MKILLRNLSAAFLFFSVLGTSLSCAAQSLATPASACPEHYNIVIGVSDKDKVELALNNAQNLQTEFGAACTNIEIVYFSAAVTLLGPMSAKATPLRDAMAQGIKLLACENSMKRFKMTEDDLLPDINTVPSGVAEIVKRQQQGWAYLRP